MKKDEENLEEKNLEENFEEEEFLEEEILKDFEEENEEKSSFASGNKKEQKLKEKIKTLEKEKQEYLDGWQRERAEMVNLKKTHLEEKKLFTNLGKEAFLKEIIPALDNFDAAFSNQEAWQKVDPAWRSGVEYIHSQFIKVLEENGVENFGKIGEDFDEKKFLSVENTDTEKEDEDGKISEVIQKGYKMGEKILREGKVKVFKKK